MRLTPGEMSALNADRLANRDAILSLLRTGSIEIPSDHAGAIALAHMAVAAAGYENPAPSSQDRARYLRLAVTASERAIASRPDAASGHYWYAVSRALELNLAGLFATIFGVHKVRRAARRACDLDESENAGGPLRIRGMLAFRLPWILGGDARAALADLERANRLFPSWRENPLFLAQLQEKLVSREAAIATLERGIALPRVTDPEEEGRWQRAMELQLLKLKQDLVRVDPSRLT